MPHSYGYRARTRSMFSKRFRDHGTLKLSKIMQTYKIGDYVDINVDSSIHKGMPYKYYHGKTAKVFNVTKNSLGVIVNKIVGNRYIEKKVTVRIEHVRPSRCREDFLKRVELNRLIDIKAKETGEPKKIIKRESKKAIPAHIVSTVNNAPVVITPLPYESLL